jgi:hypothetical protein
VSGQQGDDLVGLILSIGPNPVMYEDGVVVVRPQIRRSSNERKGEIKYNKSPSTRPEARECRAVPRKLHQVDAGIVKYLDESWTIQYTHKYINVAQIS